MKIHDGIRVGYWNPNRVDRMKNAFTPVGVYRGPEGDYVVGTLLEQKLFEGTLKFRVGVLFRPDLGKRDRMETILILENHIPEMFDYADWEKVS